MITTPVRLTVTHPEGGTASFADGETIIRHREDGTLYYTLNNAGVFNYFNSEGKHIATRTAQTKYYIEHIRHLKGVLESAVPAPPISAVMIGDLQL